VIRINLLPVRRSKKRDAATRELAIGGGVLGGLIALLYVWYVVMGAKIASTDERIAKTEAEIKRIEQDIVKVDEFKKKKRELESKLTVIDDLKAKKTGPVKLLDELASNVPKKVWLQSFDEKGGVMILEGGAGDYDYLSDFLADLTTRSHFFGKVALIYSESVQPSTSEKYAYVKFKMTGNATYGTLPVPIVSAEKK
jgi:type IV pilus assembly protein PilN